ncbi:MAG: hypothetical protein KIT70_07530 [Anaerolineales bacterium]|nr:MAG: hypothetical protein KIT70_07530 [Anaerolineales bacterium]
MRWADFAADAPELAAFGATRLGAAVAYIATASAEGTPRVHPVTPIISDELYLFMEPKSPKGKDLQRGSAYSLHCGVADSSGGQGEFYVRGHGRLVTDPAERARALAAASYAPADRYVLFALSVEFAFMNVYTENEPLRQRWPR